MIRDYFAMTKPGIIVGNAITAVGGFALASKGHIDYWLFLATLVGLSLVIASACVFNNYIDRNVDQKMVRTKNRALVRGVIPGRNAVVFAIFLGLVGILLLTLYTNLLTVLIATAGFMIYVVFYSIWKYRPTYGTLLGSIAGAVPPVVGYCAVSHRFDVGAFLLFMILVLWQMPHFFAIAMYRFEDYAAASIPVLPVKKGVHITKIHMLLYIIAFMIATFMLTFFGYTGYAYLSVAASLGAAWGWLCIKGFKTDNDKLWARKMFLHSLVIITALSVMISVDAV
jgi:heme o synthase